MKREKMKVSKKVREEKKRGGKERTKDGWKGKGKEEREARRKH